MSKKKILFAVSTSAVLGIAVYVILTNRDSSTGSLASSTTTPNMYKDGVYIETISYQVPRDTNTLKATITIKNDVITKITTEDGYKSSVSARYTSDFSSGISEAVVGKKLGATKIGIVGGASLTSNAYNKIIDSLVSKALN